MRRCFPMTLVVLSFALVGAPVWLLVWCLASVFLRGVMIIGTLIALQWPVFLVVKRLGWLPPVAPDDVMDRRETP